MILRFGKNCILFIITLVICTALLIAVCVCIPRSSIEPQMQKAETYFSSHGGFPVVVEGWAATRFGNYGDMILFNVMYHVDPQHPVLTSITSPYYRIEGEDLREQFRASVVDGVAPNNDHSRYWHGGQVLVRPLLIFTSIWGCRAIVFGLLLAMNAVLTWLLLRLRAIRPLWIYWAGMLLVQFWVCLFSLEYVMSFLVMTGACIAVAASWRKERTVEQQARSMSGICIVSGVAVCFVDLLTAETITFTVPVLLWLMLCKESGHPLKLKQLLVYLVRFGAAWLGAYAMMFLSKCLLVYLTMGREALMNVFSYAAYRVDHAIAADGITQDLTVRSAMVPAMLARNIGILFPFATRLTIPSTFGWAAGVLVLLYAAWFLLRDPQVDGALITGLLLLGAVPYVRMLVLCSHSIDHYFFTYRAQIATLMALMAVMAYSITPAIRRTGKGHRR